MKNKSMVIFTNRERNPMKKLFSVALAAFCAFLIAYQVPATAAPEKSTWDCMRDGDRVARVSIWWGHTDADAAWACNQWRNNCGNVCTAASVRSFKAPPMHEIISNTGFPVFPPRSTR